MRLKLIPHEQCRHCGARTVSESCELYHCNGEGFEVRRFECGCVASWSPNFSRLEETICPKSKKYLERKAKRNTFIERIVSLTLESEGVDAEFQQQVVKQIKQFYT